MAWFKEFYSCIALLESSDCVKWYLIDTGFIALMDQALRYHYNKDQVSELMRYRILLELTFKDKWLNLGASARALAALGENETHCPGGHYSPKVHEHFKEIVVNRLKTDNLI
jgi:hypothetical protein